MRNTRLRSISPFPSPVGTAFARSHSAWLSKSLVTSSRRGSVVAASPARTAAMMRMYFKGLSQERFLARGQGFQKTEYDLATSAARGGQGAAISRICLDATCQEFGNDSDESHQEYAKAEILPERQSLNHHHWSILAFRLCVLGRGSSPLFLAVAISSAA